MVKEAVGNDTKLQTELLTMLINANDAQEGLYWAKEYEIPKDEWPWAIVHIEEQSAQSNDMFLSIFLYLHFKEYL